ncbi:hypothetical protein ACH5RR_028954 [Cinchona calisaya]|uniref:Glycosyltransferase n=1 Tax=Cinchona calisaya TaxID=153742 RepID=A0ABD2YVJ2_9GENT
MNPVHTRIFDMPPTVPYHYIIPLVPSSEFSDPFPSVSLLRNTSLYPLKYFSFIYFYLSRFLFSPMEKIELVMIIAPLMGHLPSSLELAKLMLQRNSQLSITFLIMKAPFDPKGTAKIQSLIAACNIDRLQFHHLPTPEDFSQWKCQHRGGFITQLIDSQKPHVRETLSKLKGLSGIIVDMINTTMIDVADDVGVPSYLLFNPGAAFLGLLFHFQNLEDKHGLHIYDLVNKETELVVPSFDNPVPTSVLPVLTTRKEVWLDRFLKCTRDYRRVKGILVNSFANLETYAIDSFSINSSSYGESGLPPIYPVGPILNWSEIQGKSSNEYSEMMNWLDSQPKSSVVFLCFGSMGSFKLDQVKEIADAVERSGYRFLWVLRERPPKSGEFADDFENHGLVLPEGFLDRTASIGRVVGWVPQVAVLSHPAVGGFVYHSGWNSSLESLWHGVPMATWPLHAEQQLNAFELVKELGISVEITLEYFEANENQAIVSAEKVEKAIRELMDSENEVRKRVKELSKKCRLALEEGGSSYLSLENFMQTFGCNFLKYPNS